jgi:sucrose-6-phosphate hydrolase SacC (GH32 family)
LPLLALDCSDDPVDEGASPCAPAAPIFLSSKLDDDDGDGNSLDENFPWINDEDDDIADHCWIQDRDGVYHLFFQNEGHGTGSDIEHYVSTDLRSLAYVGVALAKNTGGWDSYALWAPHIVEKDRTYFMFYTGTTGAGNDPSAVQRIGVATSTDLNTWTRLPVNRCSGTSGDGCVYECAESWTTWGEPGGAYESQCRDPFVVWDAANRRWVLFATAKSTNGFGTITVAYSADLTGWAGAGYIGATRRGPAGTGGQTTGGQSENPCVMSHDGKNYLLFSDWRDPEDSCMVQNPRTMVQYATSATLAADSAGSPEWTYAGYIPDPGVNAIEVQLVGRDTWVMSQSIANRTACEHLLHRRDLQLKRVVWGPGGAFGTVDWTGCTTTSRLAPRSTAWR